MADVTQFPSMSPGYKWTLDDLDDSGLTPEDMDAKYVPLSAETKVDWPKYDRWDEEEGKVKKTPISAAMYGSYHFPFYEFDGTPKTVSGPPGSGERIPIIVRKIHHLKDAPANAKKIKYVSPSKQVLGESGLMIYMHPERMKYAGTLILDILEGPKKARKAIKDGKFAIGISGDWGWSDGKSPRGIHPDILQHILYLAELAESAGKTFRVRVWPDEDYRSNPQVGAAYRELRELLREWNLEFSFMSLRAFGPNAKYDDVSKTHGVEKLMALVEEETNLDLSEDPVSLALRYGLLRHTRSKTYAGLPEANITNFDKLLRKHPRFIDPETKEPLIRYNRDTNEAWFGDQVMREGVTEFEILKIFQEKFGFTEGRTASLQAIRDTIFHVHSSRPWSPIEQTFRECGAEVAALSPKERAIADEELSSWAPRLLGLDPANPYHREWGRKLLITLVARVLKPGCFTKTIFGIIGPPGLGKTWVLACFVGLALMGIVSKKNSTGKDLIQLLGEKVVANFDEAVAILAMSSGEIKSEVVNPTSEMRLPYGRAFSRMLRRCVYYMSANETGFLPNDIAGGMGRYALLDLRATHRKDELFPLIERAKTEEWEAERRRLLGAAVLAFERGEEFASVAGAEEIALEHREVPEIEVHLTDALASAEFRHRVRCDGERVGVKASDLSKWVADGGGPRYPVTGRSNPIAHALEQLGFANPGPNARFAGEKNVWTMDKSEFLKEFGEGRDAFGRPGPIKGSVGGLGA